MLFIPEKKVKETSRRIRERTRKERKEQTLKRRQKFIKAKEEGKLDEYYEELSNKWDYSENGVV